jgi:hypothetical protein
MSAVVQPISVKTTAWVRRINIYRGAASSSFSQIQREGMQPLFTGRDEIITLLSRGDPASADRLSDLYVSYRQIMNR